MHMFALRSRCAPRRCSRLRLHSLEDRAVPASMVVTSLADSRPSTLRQAVLDANAAPGADTISLTVTGTITLTSGQLVVTDSLTINGLGSGLVSVSGNNTSRVFYSSGPNTIDLTLSG